jgi:hypothetical protein
MLAAYIISPDVYYNAREKYSTTPHARPMLTLLY